MSYTIRSYNRKTGKTYITANMGFATKREALAVMRYAKSQAPKSRIKKIAIRVIKIR